MLLIVVIVVATIVVVFATIVVVFAQIVVDMVILLFLLSEQ